MFYLTGFAIALLEEFITQGVLKRNLLGWIIPTFIAFPPFLFAASMVHKYLQKRTVENRAVLSYYLISGVIGLMIEWFLIGLSPWNNPGTDPFLMLIFQLGIFSFWGTVAFAPRLLLDKRTMAASLRKWFKRSLTVGFAIIYFATLTSAKPIQFPVGVISVLAVFLTLNIFYFDYFRSLRATMGKPSWVQRSNSVTAKRR